MGGREDTFGLSIRRRYKKFEALNKRISLTGVTGEEQRKGNEREPEFQKWKQDEVPLLELLELSHDVAAVSTWKVREGSVSSLAR
jgi:hypothetical protein